MEDSGLSFSFALCDHPGGIILQIDCKQSIKEQALPGLKVVLGRACGEPNWCEHEWGFPAAWAFLPLGSLELGSQERLSGWGFLFPVSTLPLHKWVTATGLTSVMKLQQSLCYQLTRTQALYLPPLQCSSPPCPLFILHSQSGNVQGGRNRFQPKGKAHAGQDVLSSLDSVALAGMWGHLCRARRLKAGVSGARRTASNSGDLESDCSRAQAVILTQIQWVFRHLPPFYFSGN